MADWIVWSLAALVVVLSYLLNPTLGIVAAILVAIWATAWFGGYMPASLD